MKNPYFLFISITIVFLSLSCCLADTITVGGVPASRITSSALFSSNAYYRSLRTSLEDNFGPGKTVSSRSMAFQEVGNSSSFDAADLNGIDVFVAGSKNSYSTAEADALYGFVVAGGNLIVASDYSAGDANHVNVIASKFGVTFQSGWNPNTSFPIQTGAEFVTNGSFGNLAGQSEYTGSNAVSQISSLGSYATAVSLFPSSTIARTALIAPGVLGSGSGAVLFFNDWLADTFGRNSNANNVTRNVFFNYFSNVSSQIPEPSTSLLFCLAFAAIGFWKLKK